MHVHNIFLSKRVNRSPVGFVTTKIGQNIIKLSTMLALVLVAYNLGFGFGEKVDKFWGLNTQVTFNILLQTFLVTS